MDLLQKAYAAELETVANYLANSVWLDGLRAEEIKESLAEDIDEELGHAKQLAHRLKILGAAPRGSLELERSQKSLQPPADSTDMLSVIRGVIEAERNAIKGYKQLIKACEGNDYATQDLAIKIWRTKKGICAYSRGFCGVSRSRSPRNSRNGSAGAMSPLAACPAPEHQLSLFALSPSCGQGERERWAPLT